MSGELGVDMSGNFIYVERCCAGDRSVTIPSESKLLVEYADKYGVAR